MIQRQQLLYISTDTSRGPSTACRLCRDVQPCRARRRLPAACRAERRPAAPRAEPAGRKRPGACGGQLRSPASARHDGRCTHLAAGGARGPALAPGAASRHSRCPDRPESTCHMRPQHPAGALSPACVSHTDCSTPSAALLPLSRQLVASQSDDVLGQSGIRLMDFAGADQIPMVLPQDAQC